MPDFAAYRIRPVIQRLTARLRRPVVPATGEPAKPFRPRGRTHYSDDTTTIIGRTLITPNGMFRIADLASYRPVPQIEPRERARDAAGMSAFVVGLLAAVAGAATITYVVMASAYGAATAGAFLGTAIVGAVALVAYAGVVLARWRVVYDRDPLRYRHVIVAVHRGESVAITPDLPYETAGRIVAVLDKVKRKIPKTTAEPRREAAA